MTNLVKHRIEYEDQAQREYIKKQFSLSLVEDKFDMNNVIQTKAQFSHVIAVMGKIGGWEEEESEQNNRVGPRIAVSLWICTKGVVRNGQNHMQNCRT